MSDRIKQILDHVLPYHTPSAALAIISMSPRVQDRLNQYVSNETLALIENISTEELLNASLQKIQAYNSSRQAKAESKDQISVMDEYVKNYSQYVLETKMTLPETLKEVEYMGDVFHTPFHIMLGSALLTRESPEGSTVQTYLANEEHRERYNALFENAIVGLDATYCTDMMEKSTILGLVLIRPDTRQSIPLAFDYAPSESADFVIPFLRKVFGSIAAMLGRETWEPSQIIVDKHDGLRLALDNVCPRTKKVLCHFHMYRAIANKVRSICREFSVSTTPVVNGERYPFQETIQAQEIMRAFKSVRLARTEEESDERKRAFFINDIPKVMGDVKAAQAMSTYFQKHWFCEGWMSYWMHHKLRDAESNDLNFSTNNNIESTWRLLAQHLATKSLFSDGDGFLGCGTHRLTPTKVLKGLVSFLYEQDLKLMQSYSTGSSGKNPNPVIKRYRKLVQRMELLLKDNRVFLYPSQDQAKKIFGWEIEILSQNTQKFKLDTIGDETHCECTSFTDLNGQPCIHWLLWYVLSGDGHLPRDMARFVQYRMQLAAAYGSRTGTIDLLKDFSQILKTTRKLGMLNAPIPQQDILPAPLVATTWLPDVESGTWPLNSCGTMYNLCVYNSFIVATLAALEYANVPRPTSSTNASSFLSKMLTISEALQRQDYLRMYDSWSSRPPGDQATRLETLYPVLSDDANILAQGYIFARSCTNRDCESRNNPPGIWRGAESMRFVVILPPIDNTVDYLMSLSKRGVTGDSCGLCNISGSQRNSLSSGSS